MATAPQTNTPYRKIIGIPLSKAFEKDPKDGTLKVNGYFTSDNKDEVGDMITRGATERALPKYRTWGNIRYMHLPRPVAKVLRIGSEDGLEWNEVEIKVIDPQAVFEVEQGLLQALSVGILINFDDIEMMQDGGWIINDYQLAEISLVDHPANYDARLKNLASGELRTLAREYGMDLAQRALAAAKEELIMPDQVEAIHEETEETPAIEVASIEEAVEEPAEDVLVEEAAQVDESPVEEELPAEVEQEASPVCPTVAHDAEVDEEIEEVVEEPAVVSDENIELASTADEVYAAFAEVVMGLTEQIGILIKALEAKAEVPQAEEQAVSDEAQIELALEPAEPEEETPGPAVNRTSEIPETVIPDQKSVEAEPQRPTSLKDALRKHFNIEEVK